MARKSDFFAGVLAGAVLGAIGFKYYSDHKEEILKVLDGIADGTGLSEVFAEDETEEDNDSYQVLDDGDELTEEELELQKERIEDLIASKRANRH